MFHFATKNLMEIPALARIWKKKKFTLTNVNRRAKALLVAKIRFSSAKFEMEE